MSKNKYNCKRIGDCFIVLCSIKVVAAEPLWIIIVVGL